MLASGGVEALPELILIPRPGSYYYNGDISGLGCGYSFGEPGLVGGPPFAALGVCYCSFGSVSDALEGSDCVFVVLGAMNYIVAILTTLVITITSLN